MPCPHCASATTARLTKTTALEYQTFRCAACLCTFNDGTGTPFNFLVWGRKNSTMLSPHARRRGAGH
jgi:transposase-like protein